MTQDELTRFAFLLYDNGYRYSDGASPIGKFGLTDEQCSDVFNTIFHLQCDNEQLRLCSVWNCNPEDLIIHLEAGFDCEGDVAETESTYEHETKTLSAAFSELLELSKDPGYNWGEVTVVNGKELWNLFSVILSEADDDAQAETYSLDWLTEREVA